MTILTDNDDGDGKYIQEMYRFDKFLENSNLLEQTYQRNGVLWCIKNEMTEAKCCGDDLKISVKGGFICDEMGLGKTITMIGTIFANKSIQNKTLIILPPILFEQWVAQITKTLNYAPLEYYGKEKKSITITEIETAYITVTTYHTALSSYKKNGLLHRVKWNRVILDEAHHIRNINNIHKACFNLKKNITWLLSGTPIQNKEIEFNNMCSIIGFPETYIEQILSNETKLLEYSEKKYDNYRHNFKKINITLDTFAKQFILKRTKKQVGLDLKDYEIINKHVKWNSIEEKSIADSIHSRLNCCGGSSNNMSEKEIENASHFSKQGTFKLLLRARQICISTQLFTDQLITQNYDKHEIKKISSKLENVIDTLIVNNNNNNNNDKKIVFCTYRSEIDIIHNELESNNIDVKYIDGRITIEERKQILIDSPDIVILQIETGCEGLNLQQYNEIYFVSPHWNPSIEEQAIARCHRLGQQKTVLIYRFYMCDLNDKNNENNNIDDDISDITIDSVLINDDTSDDDTSDDDTSDDDTSDATTISFDKYIKQKQIEKKTLAKKIFK
jgi:SNF2 family DNA or RNA helicase